MTTALSVGVGLACHGFQRSGRRFMAVLNHGGGSLQWRPMVANATTVRAVLTDSPTYSQSSVTQAWRGTDSGTGAIVGVDVGATSLIPQAEIISRVSRRSF
jgi:hypothetical protein